jgi:hypothetical protein
VESVLAYDQYHRPAVVEEQPPVPEVVPPAPKRRWPTVLVVCGAGVLSLSLLGAAVGNFRDDKPVVRIVVQALPASNAPAPKKTERATAADRFGLAPGRVMTVAGAGGSVQDAVLLSFKVYGAGCGGYGIDPKRGSYLVADLLVQQRRGVGAVNPLYFTFVGDDGATADAISGTFSNCGRTELGATSELRAGAKRAGQVVFDVGSPRGTVEYAPGGLGTEAVGSWKASWPTASNPTT